MLGKLPCCAKVTGHTKVVNGKLTIISENGIIGRSEKRQTF
jgi:hypothetical protein